jgi:hypothetical protein
MHNVHLIAGPLSPAAAVLAGALLLVLGRRLFWLVVGIVGFFAVYSLALDVLRVQPAWARLALAVVAGVAGILLAILAQKAAVAIAGFAIGAAATAQLMGWDLARLTAGRGLVVLVVAVLVAVLAVGLFDLALVVLSSIAGAGLIVEGLRLGAGLRLAATAVLIALGVLIQLGLLAHDRRTRPV